MANKTRLSPGYFEGSEKADTAEDGEAEGGHELFTGQDQLQQARYHNKEVKPAVNKTNGRSLYIVSV